MASRCRLLSAGIGIEWDREAIESLSTQTDGTHEGHRSRLARRTPRLTVTRLGLGTGPIGGLYEAVSEEQAHAVVERAWQHGLRFFDTAPLYGYGLSEQRLGRVLRDKPRAEAVVSTKVGRLLRRDAFAGSAQVRNLSRGSGSEPGVRLQLRRVLRSFEESRERLGLARVDVLSSTTPTTLSREALEEAYPALDRLRDRRFYRRRRGRHESVADARRVRAAREVRLLPTRRSLHAARPVRPRHPPAALPPRRDLDHRRRRLQLGESSPIPTARRTSTTSRRTARCSSGRSSIREICKSARHSAEGGRHTVSCWVTRQSNVSSSAAAHRKKSTRTSRCSRRVIPA